MAFGRSAAAHLGAAGLQRLASKHRMQGPEELQRKLEEDADLGVDIDSEELLYACAAMEVDLSLANMTGRRLHEHHGHAHGHGRHSHGHHSHGHGHSHSHSRRSSGSATGMGLPRRMLRQEQQQEQLPPPPPLPSMPQQQPRVQQEGEELLPSLGMLPASQPDPTNFDTSASGVPLLHSRPAATRKIFLDFDGHTTR